MLTLIVTLWTSLTQSTALTQGTNMFEIFFTATKWGFTILAGTHGSYDTYAHCQLAMLEHPKFEELREYKDAEFTLDHTGIHGRVQGAKFSIVCREK
jgi:hypothetical protein